MRRSAARFRMASRSPGRRRIVIRSTARSLLDVRGGKSGTSETSNVRMTISASVGSDTRSFAATSVNARFSCGVGRAVIDGAVDFRALSFTARHRLLRQNADTSLSCLHSNTDPTTLQDAEDDDSTPIASRSSLRQAQYSLGAGLMRARADSSGRRETLAGIDQRPP